MKKLRKLYWLLPPLALLIAIFLVRYNTVWGLWPSMRTEELQQELVNVTEVNVRDGKGDILTTLTGRQARQAVGSLRTPNNWHTFGCNDGMLKDGETPFKAGGYLEFIQDNSIIATAYWRKNDSSLTWCGKGPSESMVMFPGTRQFLTRLFTSQS